jgi:hypothetical protein
MDDTIAAELVAEDSDPVRVRVRVGGGGGKTVHDVTVARRDLGRLAREGEDPAAFVERCFRFLLAREPKESILRSFDVTVIGRYFPEFEREIGPSRSRPVG